MKELSSPLTQEELSDGNLALIVIDMQYNITAQGHGVLKNAEELGVREGYEYYYDRIQNFLIPNIQELLNSFRETEDLIVFTKIRSDSSSDGKQEKGSIEDADDGVILKEIRPINDDIVIIKDDPNIFRNTELDSLLREHGIDTLIMAGVLTNECV
ncbi:MAG: isochorismatase family cysteine hydrolase, partial [Candidatus Thermoplasmatota archaeon]